MTFVARNITEEAEKVSAKRSRFHVEEKQFSAHVDAHFHPMHVQSKPSHFGAISAGVGQVTLPYHGGKAGR